MNTLSSADNDIIDLLIRFEAQKEVDTTGCCWMEAIYRVQKTYVGFRPDEPTPLSDRWHKPPLTHQLPILNAPWISLATEKIKINFTFGEEHTK